MIRRRESRVGSICSNDVNEETGEVFTVEHQCEEREPGGTSPRGGRKEESV